MPKLEVELLGLVKVQTTRGGSKGGGGAYSLRPKNFSISCSFSENLAKSYVGAPMEGSPPMGNPGSAPDYR